MEKKRASDKTEPLKIIISILSPILIIFIGFYINSIKSGMTAGWENLNKRLDKIELKQEEQTKTIFKISETNKAEINKIRIDLTESFMKKYDYLKDWLLAQLNKN